MIELLVLGIGSPFADDRLGWEVVKLLEERESLRTYSAKQLQFICSDRPGPHLIELMQPAKTVFLIDAVITGSELGSLHCFKRDEIKSLGLGYSTHNFGLAEAVELGESLNLVPKNLLLYGIEVRDPKFGFEITEPITESMQQLAIQIEKDIIKLMA